MRRLFALGLSARPGASCPIVWLGFAPLAHDVTPTRHEAE